jgi:plasmid maintenance system antidote protein VapI
MRYWSTVNESRSERRSLIVEMELWFSRSLRTTPEFWANSQREVDLWTLQGRVGQKVRMLTMDDKLSWQGSLC